MSQPMASPMLQSQHNPRSTVSFNGDKFEVDLHVEDFKPEDLYVKTEGRVLTVTAKHEGRDGYKQFEESFTLPAGVRLDKINSGLSKAGVLTITAPCDSQAALPDKSSSELVQPSVVYDGKKLCIELDVREYR